MFYSCTNGKQFDSFSEKKKNSVKLSKQENYFSQGCLNLFPGKHDTDSSSIQLTALHKCSVTSNAVAAGLCNVASGHRILSHGGSSPKHAVSH